MYVYVRALKFIARNVATDCVMRRMFVYQLSRKYFHTITNSDLIGGAVYDANIIIINVALVEFLWIIINTLK